MWNPNVNGSDDENENEDEGFIPSRSSFIFLIDAFLYKSRERFEKALEIINAAMISKILTHGKDLVGIVFYNTEHSPDPKDVEGISDILVKKNTAVLLPLKELSKEIVDYFLNFNGGDYFNFETRYGCEQGNFANALWLCTTMFKRSGYKLQQNSIVLFTDNDKPYDSSQEFQIYMQKAKDLLELSIDVNVIPMADEFDYEPFYKEFICTVQDNPLDAFDPPNPQEERELASDRLYRLNYRKRCNYNLTWSLGPDVELSVRVYNMHKSLYYPKSIKLFREDNKIVTVKHSYQIGVLDEETHEIRDPKYCSAGDKAKVITVGGEKVKFSEEELAKMRGPLPPELKLLGFKPISAFNLHNFIKTPSFMYPTDDVIDGSVKLFRTLWEQCLAKQKAALCVMIPKRRSNPCYVALIPTKKSEDEREEVPTNDGFLVVYLPFEVDFRNFDLEDKAVPELPPEDIELFKKLTKKLRRKYKPSLFKDPSLKALHDNIIRLAFDFDMEADDNVTPDVKLQDERIQQYVDIITQKFGEDLVVTKRRRGEGDEGSQPPKAAKITDDQITRDKIQELIDSNSLERLTIKQLKGYLQQNNVSGISSATKPVLCNKIRELHS